MKKYTIERRRWLLCLVLIAGINRTQAQNTNNPYSIYGFGDIDNRSHNRTSGMGGTGLALTSSAYLIDNNPASITGLTRSYLSLNAAVAGRTITFSGDPVNYTNNKSNEFWIKKFTVATKLNKFWASSAGFRQFSTINYSFTGTREIEGSTTVYPASYQGDGGLNEYFFTNAFNVGKRLSLGVKASVVAGAIRQTETVSSVDLGTAVTTSTEDYYGKARVEAGALYSIPLSKKWNFSIGGRYAPKLDMNSERILSVSESGTSVLAAEPLSSNSFSLPTTMAVGIAFKKNNSLTYALDYTHEDWSSLKIRERGWQLINSDRINGGIEWPRKKKIGNQYLERGFYQAGLLYHQSYLQVRNQPIAEYGVTVGLGGIIGKGLLYTLSLEGGVRGTTQQSLIKENYFQLGITLSYLEFLMSKGRKYN